jgi:hypothetical protein
MLGGFLFFIILSSMGFKRPFSKLQFWIRISCVDSIMHSNLDLGLGVENFKNLDFNQVQLMHNNQVMS